MKKLLFAAYSLDIGGIETSLVNLLDNIDYNKYQVTLILEKKEGIFLDKINKNVIVKELKVSNYKIKIIRKIINYLRKKVFSIKNKNKFDFSCCYATYSYSSNVLALIASKNSSIYVHSNYKYIYNKEDYLKFFNSRNIELFKHIIFVSNESRNSFNDYYKELKDKTLVFNNFVNVDEIIELSKENINEVKPQNGKLFVFVGRIEDTSKRIDRLINIVENIKDITLWLVGDGVDKNKYEDIVREKKLYDRVFFLGKKKNPYPYINLADYIILTSEYEGFPVVYLESLVLNKNIITTIDVSDETIEMKKYSYLISKDKDKEIEEIKEILKKDKKNNKLSIKKIQKERMKQLEKIFDDEV